jgi:hypothetical protein
MFCYIERVQNVTLFEEGVKISKKIIKDERTVRYGNELNKIF